MILCLPSNCISCILTYIDAQKDELDFHISIMINQEIASMEVPYDSYLDRFFGVEDSDLRSLTFLKRFEKKPFWYKMSLKQRFPTRFEDFKAFLKEAGIDRILPVPVLHCRESVGFVIDIKGKRIVYSGDCKMTPQLASYGKNADILIHEATFDCSAELLEVVSKNHSNIRHALIIAKDMNAKYICLTHFSQRYSFQSESSASNQIVIPHEKDLLDIFYKRTFLAQDHMYFDFETVSTLQSIHLLVNCFYEFTPDRGQSK